MQALKSDLCPICAGAGGCYGPSPFDPEEYTLDTCHGCRGSGVYRPEPSHNEISTEEAIDRAVKAIEDFYKRFPG